MKVSTFKALHFITQAAAVLSILVALGEASDALAQTPIPTTIKIVVPAAPGGALDVVAREVAQRMGPVLKTNVIVENKPGAGNVIGGTFTKMSAPDGGTITISAPSQMGATPHLYKIPPYNPLEDFAPISRLTKVVTLFAVPKSLNVKTIAELIALAKSRDGAVKFASPGLGTSSHLCGEVFAQAANVKLTMVHYANSPQSILDLARNEVQLVCSSYLSLKAVMSADQVTILATTDTARSRFLPDVPTLLEAGIKGVEASTEYSLYAPAKVPADLIRRYNEALKEAIADPSLVKALGDLGMEAAHSTPEELLEATKIQLVAQKAALDQAKIQPQ